MKLKEITVEQALARFLGEEIYILIRVRSTTDAAVLSLADGFMVVETEPEEAPAPAPAQVEPIRPAGTFTHEDQWTEEEKPTQKKGKYDVGKICALRRASWSVAKIADEIGCSEQTVRNILKREGMV